MLKGKKILLGISGSIAAYKCAHLCRLLVKAGAEVKVVMTNDAQLYVSPLTLGVLSKHKVIGSFYNEANEWNNHVELGIWADVFLIAPVTANTLAKMANGICDNVLLAVYLSARCKSIIAPAMDLDMYRHSSTKRNLKQLEADGVTVIPAEQGELASGLNGEGRMAEPEHIVSLLESHFYANNKLRGKRVLITAGPTYEAIDPVRFIGNRSSGKMGIAIAEAFAEQGAEVTLIHGPITEMVQHKSIHLIPVETSEEMYEACMKSCKEAVIIIMAAAVSDYTPEISMLNKLKKKHDQFTISLKKTKDILAELGKLKKKNQVLVGFSLETENLIKNAQEKLKRKKLDFIVANQYSKENKVFGSDNNKVSVIDKHNKIINFELMSKKKLAESLVNLISK